MTLKVYIVTDGEYEDTHIERVFLDPDLAEEFSNTLPAGSVNEYEICTTIPKRVTAYCAARNLETEHTSFTSHKVWDDEPIPRIDVKQDRNGKPYFVQAWAYGPTSADQLLDTKVQEIIKNRKVQ